jgi:two-component system, chemotaxis family, chemotaxis protein CheY
LINLKHSVLVADDMASLRKIIIKTLKGMGFEFVLEAADGEQAYQAVLTSTNPVGLIISDWNMPVCNGLDFLKKVKADPRFARIPFMMVTAETEKEQVAEAIKAGVNGYIIKPFTGDTLIQKINSLK